MDEPVGDFNAEFKALTAWLGQTELSLVDQLVPGGTTTSRLLWTGLFPGG